MRFSVSQESLSKALNIVSRGVAANSSQAILSGVCLSVEEGVLELQTTDLTLSIRHKIAANVEEPGQALVSWKTLNALVKTLPDGAVLFNENKNTVELSCGKGLFKLNSLDPADFPSFPEVVFNESIELPTKLLEKMVDKVYRATSRDNSRPILSGILTKVEDNTIRLVATDSFRLSLVDSHTETAGLSKGFEVNIPGRVFHDVLNLPSDSDKLFIGFNENQILFIFGNTTYVTRRIEGNYPSYTSLITSNPTTTIKTDVSALSEALKQVSVIASSNPEVRFIVNPEETTLKVYSFSPEQGEASVEIPAEAEGNALSVAFNYHYLADCISAISDEKELIIELQDAVQPALFKTFSDINYLYLLMLIRQ